jgi:hypothetical protein
MGASLNGRVLGLIYCLGNVFERRCSNAELLTVTLLEGLLV